MSRWDNYSTPAGSKLGEPQVPVGLQPPLYNVIWQSEGSNSKVVGNRDDLLVEDTMDTISSVLRKEFEGKVYISNLKIHFSVLKGKESLGDSIEDTKEDFLSNSSIGTHTKNLLPFALPSIPIKQWTENLPTEKGKQWRWKAIFTP